jgi:hypothetical protein
LSFSNLTRLLLKRSLRALIDLHSHALMDPFFSRTDNKDEQGFRIFAVIGKVNEKPLILVRVGVYGNYWNIPADLVFELPGEIRDACYGKGEVIYDETNIEEEDFQILSEEEIDNGNFPLCERDTCTE